MDLSIYAPVRQYVITAYSRYYFFFYNAQGDVYIADTRVMARTKHIAVDRHMKI